jgi:hypothetical protein
VTASLLRALIAAAACIAALTLYAHGFQGEPRLRGSDFQQRTYAAHILQGDAIDLIKEAALAEAYWLRNQDVAANSVFGRSGQLGIHGAREHYNQHGQREGRVWGMK